MRIYGLIFNSAWVLFDKSHLAPKEHYNLVKCLGRVKDYADNRQINIYANQAQDMLCEYSGDCKDDFTPADKNSFDGFLSTTLKGMENIVCDLMSIDISKYHNLRKRGTRHVMNLFQIASANSLTQEWFQTFRYFKHIDSLIGKGHDMAIADEVQSLEVDTKIIGQLCDGMSFIRTQWNIG